MIQCNWIVENFSEGEDIFRLIKSIKDVNLPLSLINRRNGFEYKHIQMENIPVIFYGSINMAKLIKSYLKSCYPVIWDSDKFECINYWPHFQSLLFNDKYEIMSIKTLKENKWEVYSKYGKEALIFIRPSTGDKSFAGQLLDLNDFDKFFENSTKCNANDNDIVIVSTPKNIIGEWRFIATSDKKIIGKSGYRFQGKAISLPGAPDGATKMVEKVLSVGYFPARVFALDIAEDIDGNYWLMEFNSFNSCGLYGINTDDLVRETTEIALDDFNNKK